MHPLLAGLRRSCRRANAMEITEDDDVAGNSHSHPPRDLRYFATLDDNVTLFLYNTYATLSKDFDLIRFEHTKRSLSPDPPPQIPLPSSPVLGNAFSDPTRRDQASRRRGSRRPFLDHVQAFPLSLELSFDFKMSRLG